jgi:hypothetical protein
MTYIILRGHWYDNVLNVYASTDDRSDNRKDIFYKALKHADHSPPSSAEINMWNYTSTTPYAFMVWYLVKHRDNFTFAFTFAQCRYGIFCLNKTLTSIRKSLVSIQKLLQMSYPKQKFKK